MFYVSHFQFLPVAACAIVALQTPKSLAICFCVICFLSLLIAITFSSDKTAVPDFDPLACLFFSIMSHVFCLGVPRNR